MSAPRRHLPSPANQPGEEHWLDRAVGEARRRGDFDDLPRKGEPIPLGPAQAHNEWELAFSILKNAGYAPYWVEVGKEIDTAVTALQASRGKAAVYVQERLAQVGSTEPPAATEHRPSSRFFKWLAKPHQPAAKPELLTIEDVEAERLRLRAGYIEEATELDAKIREYHRALPDDLWRLQRPRQSPGQAAADFDLARPPVS